MSERYEDGYAAGRTDGDAHQRFVAAYGDDGQTAEARADADLRSDDPDWRAGYVTGWNDVEEEQREN